MPHIHDKYDFTISAFIVFAGKVLLVNHPRYQLWIPPGGHVELDEDPEQAFFREVQEETGLEVEILSSKPSFASPGTKPLFTPNFMDVHEANAPHKHISLTYFAKAASSEFVKSDEHEDMKWFSLTDLEDKDYKLSPAIKFYCQQAIKLSQ